jgi:hypothetical protein
MVALGLHRSSVLLLSNDVVVQKLQKTVRVKVPEEGVEEDAIEDQDWNEFLKFLEKHGEVKGARVKEFAEEERAKGRRKLRQRVRSLCGETMYGFRVWQGGEGSEEITFYSENPESYYCRRIVERDECETPGDSTQGLCRWEEDVTVKVRGTEENKSFGSTAESLEHLGTKWVQRGVPVTKLDIVFELPSALNKEELPSALNKDEPSAGDLRTAHQKIILPSN